MSRQLKSSIVRRLRATVAESSRTAASCGISSCARGTRYIDLTEAIVYWRGRVNTLKESRHYRKNLILRPSRSRRCEGKHVLYTCHIPKSWSAACVANRELIKLAQSRAHAIYADPLARAEWEPMYLEHKANPAPHTKPYSTIYHFIYNAIYQSLRAEYLAARSVLVARVSHLAQSIHPCRPCLALAAVPASSSPALGAVPPSFKYSVRAISMSASRPAPHPVLSIVPAYHAGSAPVRRASVSLSRPLIRLPIAA